MTQNLGERSPGGDARERDVGGSSTIVPAQELEGQFVTPRRPRDRARSAAPAAHG